MAFRHIWAAALLAGLAFPLPSTADEDGASLPAPATIRVLSARVRPLKPDGTPWDGDHRKVPRIVYEVGGRLAGFPGLGLLASIPYRNRPDPKLEVRQGEERSLGRHRAIQGTFLPTWLLTVEPRDDEGASSVVTFELIDDDVREDDAIGKAMLDLDVALKRPGVHVLEGTGGLHDLTIVIRNPALKPDAPPWRVELLGATVKARAQRPAGGDWDAGGNPLREKMRRLPLGEKVDGLDTAKPDLKVALVWSDGDARDLGSTKDAYEHVAKDLGWSVVGREGIGDGLFLRVADDDSLLDDPVGVLFIPLSSFLEARREGTLVIESDETSGIEGVTLTFRVEAASLPGR